jgi:hypothetical protein
VKKNCPVTLQEISFVHGAVIMSIRMIQKRSSGPHKKVVQEFLAAKCIRTISNCCYFLGLALANFFLYYLRINSEPVGVFLFKDTFKCSLVRTLWTIGRNMFAAAVRGSITIVA